MRIKKVKIAILGSTGSIGRTTLDILEKYKNKFQVNMLVCNKNKWHQTFIVNQDKLEIVSIAGGG